MNKCTLIDIAEHATTTVEELWKKASRVLRVEYEDAQSDQRRPRKTYSRRHLRDRQEIRSVKERARFSECQYMRDKHS